MIDMLKVGATQITYQNPLEVGACMYFCALVCARLYVYLCACECTCVRALVPEFERIRLEQSVCGRTEVDESPPPS